MNLIILPSTIVGRASGPRNKGVVISPQQPHIESITPILICLRPRLYLTIRNCLLFVSWLSYGFLQSVQVNGLHGILSGEATTQWDLEWILGLRQAMMRRNEIL